MTSSTASVWRDRAEAIRLWRANACAGSIRADDRIRTLVPRTRSRGCDIFSARRVDGVRYRLNQRNDRACRKAISLPAMLVERLLNDGHRRKCGRITSIDLKTDILLARLFALR
jgi:hypothetical protein